MYTNTFNRSLLGVFVLGSALVSGCAMTQSKLEAFGKAQGNTGFVYAQVNSVAPGIDTKKACDSEWGGEKKKATREIICTRLDQFNVTYVSVLKNNAIFTSNEIIPLSVGLRTGAIVKLDLSKEAPFRFVEVVTQEPTETCQWVGSANAFADNGITTAGKVVGGFVAGALVLPGLVYLSSDHQGGVECHGWSYKEAFKEFLVGN